MPFPTTDELDNFNRPDEALSASVNWADGWFFNVGGLRVISNQCGTVANELRSSDWVAETFTDTEVHVTLPTGLLDEIGLLARIINQRTPAASGYNVGISTDDTWTLRRWDSQNGTILATASQAVEAGDSIGMEIIGDTISCLHKPAAGSWAEVLSVTDSTYPGPGAIGLVCVGNLSRFDNFSGGEVVSGGGGIAVPVVTHHMRQQGMS